MRSDKNLRCSSVESQGVISMVIITNKLIMHYCFVPAMFIAFMLLIKITLSCETKFCCFITNLSPIILSVVQHLRTTDRRDIKIKLLKL